MKIEAVTVCVGYSDFLKHVITENKEIFDKWVIVTDTKDKETKELCDKEGVVCVQTDCFYEDGASFRKYRGINEGLKHLDLDGWVIFLDGDILLSRWTRRVLEEKNLNPDKIYGIDRFNCKGWEKFVEFQQAVPIIIDNWLLQSSGLEFGARIVHIYGEQEDNGKFTGWKPLGFFQCAHSSKFTSYPEGSADASHGDLAFAKQWSTENRELIPEIAGVHLYTEDYKGQNWIGRKSKLFLPDENSSKFSIFVDTVKVKYHRFKYAFRMALLNLSRALK